MTFRNFSASVNWRDGVKTALEAADDVTEPVGLDLRVSCGERQYVVTCSAVFSRFSISKLLVRDDCFGRLLSINCWSDVTESWCSGENMSLTDIPGRPISFINEENCFQHKTTCNSLQPGAGTIKPDIISSLIIGGSDGGGGHTIDSIISSVDRKMPARSGGSTRDDLIGWKKKNTFNPLSN